MTYAHNTEHHRMDNAERERCPVENAFRAVVALSEEDKLLFISRYNDWSAKGCHPSRLSYKSGVLN